MGKQALVGSERGGVAQCGTTGTDKAKTQLRTSSYKCDKDSLGGGFVRKAQPLCSAPVGYWESLTQTQIL